MRCRRALLPSLRQVHDSGFCVFRGYVGMARFPMLNGCFQMCDAFIHMRIILAYIQGMLQCGFRMCHEFRCVPLFALVHRFCRVIEGVRAVLLCLTQNVTPRPAPSSEYRLQGQHCGDDYGEDSGQRDSSLRCRSSHRHFPFPEKSEKTSIDHQNAPSGFWKFAFYHPPLPVASLVEPSGTSSRRPALRGGLRVKRNNLGHS